MINLKRNNYSKQLVAATGRRVMQKYIYSPNQTSEFRISRGKFQDFLTCKKCFYLDRVKGFEGIGMPSWPLNSLTDSLLKKEFDVARKNGVSHKILIDNNLSHIIPFNHPEIDYWRDALNGGLNWKKENILFTGGVDDLWFNTLTKEVIIVEYKSQAKNGLITKENYFSDVYHEQYKVQVEFYAFLLNKMGFNVSKKAYFLVVNAVDKENFGSTLKFDKYLFDYDLNTDWIEPKIDEMIMVMNSFKIPENHLSCQNCAFAKVSIEEHQNTEEHEMEIYEKVSDQIHADEISDMWIDEMKEENLGR